MARRATKVGGARGAAVSVHESRADGNDDIARGDVGTSDQGPGDVYPEDPVTARTGELALGRAAPPTWPWSLAVERALAAGQVFVTDPATGHRRSMYAPCRNDGQAAGVWRVVRGAGGAITRLTMRCSACGAEFVADPDEIFLR
jgi:hypothetical protein